MSQKAILIIDRLKEKLGIRWDRELCDLLDIKQNTLSTWKKRDSLDFNKIITLCKRMQINLDFVFFGVENEESNQEVEDGNSIKINGEKENEMELKAPKADVIKEFKLVNTNRNIGLFCTDMTCYPKIELDALIVGQKISKSKIIVDTPYIIEFMTKGFVVDELVEVMNGEYKLKHCHTYDSLIKPNEHIKNIWQLIDQVEKTQIN